MAREIKSTGRAMVGGLRMFFRFIDIFLQIFSSLASIESWESILSTVWAE